MFCKKCGHEMDDKAVMCPNCGNMVNDNTVTKKPVYKKWWFWLIIVLGVIIVIGAAASGGNTGDTASTGTGADSSAASSTETKQEEKETQPEIVYEKVSVDTLIDDLETNALKAEKTYQDKYLEITGKISGFDSDGDYISLKPINDEFNLTSVLCYIKEDNQLDFLLTKSKGDTVTIKGKVKSIGEFLGYSIDIDEVS